MTNRVVKTLLSIELEERILTAGSLIAIVGLFLPWIGGDWPGGESVSYRGLGFFTSFLGITILLLQGTLLLIGLLPLATGKPLLKKRYREFTRLCLTSQATVLVLACLSVLTKVTLEFTRMEVRYGVYVCLVGCLVALFEAIVRYVEQRKARSQEMFHHPEDAERPPEKETIVPAPPPPPPPPAPAPEEHRLYP